MKQFNLFLYKNIYLIIVVILSIFIYFFSSIFCSYGHYLLPDLSKFSGSIYIFFFIYYLIKKIIWDICLYNIVKIFFTILISLYVFFLFLIHGILPIFYEISMFIIIYYDHFYTFIREMCIYTQDLMKHQYAFIWGNILMEKTEQLYPFFENVVYYFCASVTLLFIFCLRILVWGFWFLFYWAIQIPLGDLWWFQLWYAIPLLNFPLWIVVKSIDVLDLWCIDEYERVPGLFTWYITFGLPWLYFYFYEEYIMYRIVRYMDWRLYATSDPDATETKDRHRLARRELRILMFKVYSVYWLITTWWTTKIRFAIYFGKALAFFWFIFLFYYFFYFIYEYGRFVKNITYNKITIYYCKFIYWNSYFAVNYPPNHPYNFFFGYFRKRYHKIFSKKNKHDIYSI